MALLRLDMILASIDRVREIGEMAIAILKEYDYDVPRFLPGPASHRFGDYASLSSSLFPGWHK